MKARGSARFCACLAITCALQLHAIARDVVDGLRLSERWCNSCHMVTIQNSWDDAEIAPRFRALTTTTALQLRTLFARTHKDMPALAALPDGDLAAIAAYMQSLPPDRAGTR